MQSNSSSSCSLKFPAPDMTPLQTRNNYDGTFPFGQGYPSAAENGSIISNSPDRLEMSAKHIGKKGKERNASLLYRTSNIGTKTRTDGSQSHAHSSVLVPPSSNAQKIALEKSDEINLQRSFENNPALKSTKQAPKVVAQGPAMCVSKDNEEKAYSATSIRIAKVKAGLGEQYRQSDNEISNTKDRHGKSVPEWNPKLEIEQTLRNNTDLATTGPHGCLLPQAAQMVRLDECVNPTVHEAVPYLSGSVTNMEITKAQASNSTPQAPGHPKKNQTFQQRDQAAGARVVTLMHAPETSRKAAGDLRQAAQAEILSLEQKCAERERKSSHALEEARARFLILMRECAELKVAVNEPLEEAKTRNVELEKQLGNMKNTAEESERGAKVKMQKLEKQVSKQRQQYAEPKRQFSKWETNPAEAITRMDENKQTIAEQESTIIDLKKKLEDSDAKVAKLTEKFITHEREIKNIIETEVQPLKKQLGEATKCEKDVELKLKGAEARNQKSEQLLAEIVATLAKQRAEAVLRASTQQMQDISNGLRSQLKDREATNDHLPKKLHESNESVVRLNNEHSQLKEGYESLALPKTGENGSKLQPQADSSGKIAILNQEVQLLREQLSNSDEKVAQLVQELSASDEKVAQLAQELETHRGSHMDWRTAVDLRNRSDQKESTAREIQDLESEPTKSEQDVAWLTKNLAATRSQKVTDQQLAKQVPCKDKDLVQGLAQKERRIRDLGTKLAEYENKCAFLSERLRQSVIAGSAEQQLTDLRKKIQESEAKNNRLAQDLKETQKRYLALKGVEEKLLGPASLFRGAAHLVAPPGIAKLPETVFTCIECYVKGLLCDNCSTCENCKAGGHVCSRWKCSIHKHLGYCPEMPCALVHDEDGWLITKNAIPQW